MTTRDSASSKRIVHFCTVVMDLKTAKHGYKRNVEEEHDFEQKMKRRWQHEMVRTLRSTLHLGKISDVRV